MKFGKITVALAVIMFCAANIMAANVSSRNKEINENALQGKKVLYVHGGWYGHEPEKCRDIFVPWLKSEGAEVFEFDNLGCYEDSVLMDKVDLIIQHFTQGEISGKQEKALRNAIRRGVGLAGWHGGTGDSFRMNVDFQYMVGGQWVSHPGGVIPYTVNITDKEDPVTKGLKDFDMNSEQYYMHIDPNVNVLATTTFSGEHDSWIDGAAVPVVWKKQYGEGRVFYSSLGHVAADFEVPEALEIMKRGIKWAAESLEKGPEEWLKPVYRGKAQNPFIRHIYTADPSARVWEDGRLYVYPSQDIAPPRGCDLMDQYHVFSTNDMVNWVDHGLIVEAADVPWKQPLKGDGKFMWAPDCAYKNGKYYFYFPSPNKDPWNSTWKIGIAVSDKPASGFVVLDHWLTGLPDEGHIDPNVFIDDDGQAYFYYGGGGKCYGAKLKDNMVEIDGDLILMEGLYDFHEATWVFKRNGIYYLTYSDNHDENWNDGVAGDNRMRYAMSDNPLGPWEHKGIYMEPTNSYTNHGSVVKFKGQWYSFYHDSSLSKANGEFNDWLRSVCVDKLFFNEDGTIQMVEQTK